LAGIGKRFNLAYMKKIKLLYFNSRWNLYICGEEVNIYRDNAVEVSSIGNEDHEFILRKFEVGLQVPFYTFGLMYRDERKRPGHHGEWSSRSSVINSIFGTDLLEVAYNGVSTAISAADLRKLLGDKAEVKPYVSGGETYWGVFVPSAPNFSPIEFAL
jgi:hypothetical protein